MTAESQWEVGGSEVGVGADWQAANAIGKTDETKMSFFIAVSFVKKDR